MIAIWVVSKYSLVLSRILLFRLENLFVSFLFLFFLKSTREQYVKCLFIMIIHFFFFFPSLKMHEMSNRSISLIKRNSNKNSELWCLYVVSMVCEYIVHNTVSHLWNDKRQLFYFFKTRILIVKVVGDDVRWVWYDDGGMNMSTLRICIWPIDLYYQQAQQARLMHFEHFYFLYIYTAFLFDICGERVSDMDLCMLIA